MDGLTVEFIACYGELKQAEVLTSSTIIIITCFIHFAAFATHKQ